ncbi:MAG TPA: GDP-mannose 4,6-dehydratase, partial [Chthoniobacterales bacterium]|nr:GDP-mannose 4,6-dehydratase [Chthoniobacterales bacterium]
EFLELAFAAVDLPWKNYVKRDPAFDRPSEPTNLIGNADKIRQTLGWRPSGTFAQLVREMVDAELGALKSADARS